MIEKIAPPYIQFTHSLHGTQGVDVLQEDLSLRFKACVPFQNEGAINM